MIIFDLGGGGKKVTKNIQWVVGYR